MEVQTNLGCWGSAGKHSTVTTDVHFVTMHDLYCDKTFAFKLRLPSYWYTNTNTSAFFLFSICRVWMRGWHRYIIWWWCLLDHKYKRQKWYDPALRIRMALSYAYYVAKRRITDSCYDWLYLETCQLCKSDHIFSYNFYDLQLQGTSMD